MAAVISDFALETASAAPGTGTVSLGGAPSGMKTLVNALGTGVVIRYMMFTATKSKWEKGYGTLTSGSPSTLTRTLMDSSTGSLIDWQPGDLPIYIAPLISADEIANMRAHFRGATAPTAPLQPGMIWIDTTGGVTALVWKVYIAALSWVAIWTQNESTGAITFTNAVTLAGTTTASGTFNMSGKSINHAKGAAVASAATADIWTPADGNTVHITGTTTITSLGTAPQAGARKTVIFDGALILTHSSNLKLPGGASIITAADDRAEVLADTTTAMIVTSFIKTSGTATVPMLKANLQGWSFQNAAGDVTNDIDIAAGSGMDATGVYFISGAALTKQLDANWAVGNNAGGLDTGAIGNSSYFIWAIARSDTGVVDYLFSLSASSPTMPANYDYKRLIGWIKRSGGAIVLFKSWEMPGGGLRYRWKTPAADGNPVALTTSYATVTLTVPVGIELWAWGNIISPTGGYIANIRYPGMSDGTPSNTGTPGATAGSPGTSTTNTVQWREMTNTSAQIEAAASASVNAYIFTMGFEWSRR